MFNDVLLFGALLLIAIKFGLGARLRELGRVLDRLVNVLLGLMLAGYAIQLAYLFFSARSH